MLNTPQLSLAEINNTVPVAGQNPVFCASCLPFPAGCTGGGGIYGSRKLDHLDSGRCAVQLSAAVGDFAVQPDCDAVTGNVRKTRDRHRPGSGTGYRARVGPKLAALLWITTELAIMATEIAEVIGSAVALNLLFGIPLMAGVLLTVLDVFLLLVLMKLGFRKIEAFVFVLILTIFLIFAYEVMLSDRT